jgi:hypothetical protein
MTQGAAKTTDFMLGSATIMLGPQDALFNLTDANSVGLVKNVTTKTTPGFVELTQGIRNSLVYSVMNSNAVGITAEMYEYTPSNLAYSLSLDGAQFVRQTAGSTLATAYAAPVAPAEVGDDELLLAAVVGLTVDSFVLVHTGKDDNVMIRKIISVDAGAKSIQMDSGLPMALGIGAKVEKVNVIAVGSQDNAPFLSCKIVGTLANGDTVPMLFPKVRVKSGLSMAFKTDNFDHIPFELEIYDLVEADPHFALFQTIGANGTPAKGMILD